MHVGILTLELGIYDAFSLKDKRRAIRSVKDKIAHRYNVSVAEVAALDSLRHGVLGVAMVSNDHAYVQGALDQIVDYVRSMRQADLEDYAIEFV
jgi:uncharacterized protein